MINIYDAIRALNPQVVTIRGEEAFDKDENPVAYDLAAAQAKLKELEAQELAKEQACDFWKFVEAQFFFNNTVLRQN